MRRGFTLLEVVIALAILAVSLFVLIDAEATAVYMTLDSRQTLVANALAQEKMAEVQLMLEEKGWTDANISEEGDFEDYGEDKSWGEGVEFDDAFDDFSWAYTVRKVELNLGDTTGAMESMQSAGMGVPETSDAASDGASDMDLGDLGVQSDGITDMLAPYLREVRVLVWWGDDPKDGTECENCVSLVTHLINPTGATNPIPSVPM